MARKRKYKNGYVPSTHDPKILVSISITRLAKLEAAASRKDIPVTQVVRDLIDTLPKPSEKFIKEVCRKYPISAENTGFGYMLENDEGDIFS